MNSNEHWNSPEHNEIIILNNINALYYKKKLPRVKETNIPPSCTCINIYIEKVEVTREKRTLKWHRWASSSSFLDGRHCKNKMREVEKRQEGECDWRNGDDIKEKRIFDEKT